MDTGARRFFDFHGMAFVLLENGALSITDTIGTRDNRSEAERTRDAIVAIQRWLFKSHPNVEASGYTKNMRKFCPFIGGGDIFFQCGTTSSTFFLHGEEEEEEVEEEVESREAIISENKKAPPTNDVCLQLQANMVLASAESIKFVWVSSH